jgi:hypothetical protein
MKMLYWLGEILIVHALIPATVCGTLYAICWVKMKLAGEL